MPTNTAVMRGRLGKDPEPKTSKAGNTYARFSLAVNGPQRDHTTWWNVTCFGKTAKNVMEYLAKGQEVIVTGSPYVREYQNQMGETKYSAEINAQAVDFIKPAQQQQPQPAAAAVGGQDDFIDF